MTSLNVVQVVADLCDELERVKAERDVLRGCMVATLDDDTWATWKAKHGLSCQYWEDTARAVLELADAAKGGE